MSPTPDEINETLGSVGEGIAESSKLGQKALAIGERYFSSTLAKREHKAKMLRIAHALIEGKAIIDAKKELAEYAITQWGYNKEFILNNPLGLEQLQKQVIEYTNLDSIYEKSKKYLGQVEAVPEKADHDFYMEFQKKASNIQDDSRQELWARVLARKIEDEKSFRLTTLDILSKLQCDDAEVFETLSSCAFLDQLILLPEGYNYFYERFASREEVQNLRVLNLVAGHGPGLGGLVPPIFKEHLLKWASEGARIGDTPVKFNPVNFPLGVNNGELDGHRYQASQSFGFTREGRELSEVVPKNREINIEYLKYLSEQWPEGIIIDWKALYGSGELP